MDVDREKIVLARLAAGRTATIKAVRGPSSQVKHINWLSSLEFSEPRDRKTLDMYLSTMQEIEGKCSEAAEEVEQIAFQERYREQTKKLTAFRGIKTLVALSFVAEIGDFRRFRIARQFMAYLGLVPCEHSSGNRPRQGGITKAANRHLRRLLVMTNPSQETEASCRRFNWAAVTNPRISVWSIVEKSLLRLFDHLPRQRGGKR